MNFEDIYNYQNEEEAARRLNAARGMIDPAEKEELDRMARAEAARASMAPRERERYEVFETQFRIELARHYGDRLSNIITEHLVRNLPLDHRAIQAMVASAVERSDVECGLTPRQPWQIEPSHYSFSGGVKYNEYSPVLGGSSAGSGNARRIAASTRRRKAALR